MLDMGSTPYCKDGRLSGNILSLEITNWHLMVKTKHIFTYLIILTFFGGIKWIISSSDGYLFLSPSTTAKDIPQTGWRVRNEGGWEKDDTLDVLGKIHLM